MGNFKIHLDTTKHKDNSMTFWDDALSQTTYRCLQWPQLAYVYQNPVNGEFVASNNRTLLVEHNGAIPMFEWWTPDGAPANVQGLEYVDYQTKLKEVQNDCNRLYLGEIKRRKGFAFIGELAFRDDEITRVLDFIGAERVINVGGVGYAPIYIRNADSTRQAVLSPFETHDVFTAEWDLYDKRGEIVTTCNSYQQCMDMGELMGCDYYIRVHKNGNR